MTNLASEDMGVREGLSSEDKQKSFINAFASIANKVISEYHSNTHERVKKEVKIPNQSEEDQL